MPLFVIVIFQNYGSIILSYDLYLYHIRTPDKASVPIWYDKAGGYGIQTAFGAMAVERINGDYYNVMGLPVSRLYRILKYDFGFDI